MKKIVSLLFPAMLLFGIAGFLSCRSVKKAFVHTDSTAVRSSQASEKWDRETVTDYGYPQQPAINLEDLKKFTSPDSMLLAVLQMLSARPAAEPAKPVIIRTVVRDSGEKHETKTEEKTVAVEQKQVEKTGPSIWYWLGIGAAAMFVFMLLIAVAYKIIKHRILSSLPKAA